jgi:hypothetical protein
MINWSSNFSFSCENFCVFPKLKQLVNGKSKEDVEVNFIKFKEVVWLTATTNTPSLKLQVEKIIKN